MRLSPVARLPQVFRVPKTPVTGDIEAVVVRSRHGGTVLERIGRLGQVLERVRRTRRPKARHPLPALVPLGPMARHPFTVGRPHPPEAAPPKIILPLGIPRPVTRDP